MNTEITLTEAIAKLRQALKTDRSYFLGWQANIAMAFIDAYDKASPEVHLDHIHEIANEAAFKFLTSFMAKSPLPEREEAIPKYVHIPQTSTKHTSRCLLKAGDDEPIFVLRAKDETAPLIVMHWVNANMFERQPFEKCIGAMELAQEMKEWRKKNVG